MLTKTYFTKTKLFNSTLQKIVNKHNTTHQKSFFYYIKTIMNISNCSIKLLPKEIDKYLERYLHPSKFDIEVLNHVVPDFLPINEGSCKDLRSLAIAFGLSSFKSLYESYKKKQMKKLFSLLKKNKTKQGYREQRLKRLIIRAYNINLNKTFKKLYDNYMSYKMIGRA